MVNLAHPIKLSAQQCADERARLAEELTDTEKRAKSHAPATDIVEPETLKDVQAILYRKLVKRTEDLKAQQEQLERACAG